MTQPPGPAGRACKRDRRVRTGATTAWEDVPGDRLGDGGHDGVEFVRHRVVLVALNREVPVELLREREDGSVQVEVTQERHREGRCQAGGEHVNGEVGVRLRLIELAVARENDVLCEALVLLPEDVVPAHKPFEEPLGVWAVEDVDRPLAETVEHLADIQRNIRVVLKVPALVVDRRRRNTVPVAIVEHALIRDRRTGCRACVFYRFRCWVAERPRGRRISAVALEFRRDRHGDVDANITIPAVFCVDPAECRRRVARLC